MSTTTAGILFLASLVVALAAVHVPLGDYMYRVYSSGALAGRASHLPADRRRPQGRTDLGRLRAQRAGLLGVSILFLFIFSWCRAGCRCTSTIPATPMTPALAWNTAISFVTNTNWQAYSGESTQGHLVQMAGLAVQNFVSAAVGMAVAMALVRGFARTQHRRAGQLLGRPGARHAAHPAAHLRRRRDDPDRRRRDPELPRCTIRSSTPSPAASRPSPAARSPARK